MHKAQGPAQFADAQSGFADKLEQYTFARASELNKTFSWNEDNISRFYELNQFLCEKQRLLYRKVESALAASHTALKTDPEFLGGEVEIQGRLMLAPPYDEKYLLPGLSEPVFSAMVERANRRTYDVTCSTYHALEPYDSTAA